MHRIRRIQPAIRALANAGNTNQVLRREFSQIPLLERILMNVPKGFEKFYRNPNSNKDNKQQPNNNNNGDKGDKKGGGKGGPNKPEDYDAIWKTAGAVGILLFLLMGFEDTKFGR